MAPSSGQTGLNPVLSVTLRVRLFHLPPIKPIESALGRTLDCKSGTEVMWFDSISRHEIEIQKAREGLAGC